MIGLGLFLTLFPILGFQFAVVDATNATWDYRDRMPNVQCGFILSLPIKPKYFKRKIASFSHKTTLSFANDNCDLAVSISIETYAH